MKPMRWALIFLLAVVSTQVTHAGLADKLASPDADKREKALKKFNDMWPEDEAAFFASLTKDFKDETRSDKKETLAHALTNLSCGILGWIDHQNRWADAFDGIKLVAASNPDIAADAFPTLLARMKAPGEGDPLRHSAKARLTLQSLGKGIAPKILEALKEENAQEEAVLYELPGGVPFPRSHLIVDLEGVLYDLLGQEGLDLAARQQGFKSWQDRQSKRAKKRENDENTQARQERESYSEVIRLAKAGDANAQNELGTMHIEGKGVKQDFGEAFKWLAKAQAKGSPEAEQNLYALLRRDIMSEMVAEDVKWGKQPLNFMMPIPGVLGKLYNRERPLWVFVDAGWAFTSAYEKREYVLRLLRITRRYPLKIDAVTIRHWGEDNQVSELAYVEAPWTKVIFGDTLKTITAENIAPHLPKGLTPVAPQEGILETEAPAGSPLPSGVPATKRSSKRSEVLKKLRENPSH